MRIERVTDLNEILKCVPYEQDIRSKGRDVSSISTMLLSISELISNPLFGYWIAYDDDKIVGYMSAIASRQKNLKRILLLRMYASSKKIREKFNDTLKEFGREFKIKPGIVRIEMFRHDRAMQRLGWNKVSTIMEKRIY